MSILTFQQIVFGLKLLQQGNIAKQIGSIWQGSILSSCEHKYLRLSSLKWQTSLKLSLNSQMNADSEQTSPYYI